VQIKVSGNMGRRYAAVSGDYSPHHLYGWAAWLLGYPKQIAHGMWTLSRCLAEVELYYSGQI
jgi:acyl dehydratase